MPIPKNERGLTEKQQRFVEAFTGEAKGNATEAARIAGYKGNAMTLGQVAAENLKKPQIQEAIKSATAAVRSRAVMTRAERQALLTAIAREEVTEEVVLTVGTGMGCSEIEKTTKKANARARLKAIELLGKMQGDFIDKLEVKTEGAFRAQLESLKKDMSASAFQELLACLAKVGGK